MSVGYDTHWARRKLERARAHLTELERASAGWLGSTTHPLDVVLADDGRHLELVLPLVEPPPLEEWSLIAGDCVHNIRTALDVFIWANSTKQPERERRRAAYPTLPYADEEDPDVSDRLEDQPSRIRGKVERKVAGLPDPLCSRVLDNMRRASLPDGDHLVRHQRLPLITELDDVDKHRLAVDLKANVSSATWDVRTWGPSGEDVRVDLHWEPDLGTPTTRRERLVMATGRPDGPIARIQGDATVSLDLRVQVLDRSLNVLPWLGYFIEDVNGLLDVLGAPVD